MDIAKVFQELSKGRIISANSNKDMEYSNLLINEDFFKEMNDAVDKIGYKLIGENGYYYIAKKGRLTTQEHNSFISSHRDTILAISFLTQLNSRLDKKSIISYIDTIANYSTLKANDSTIKEKLTHLSWMKNKDDDRDMIEQLFKNLEKVGIIEKIDERNSDKYKVLDAYAYYISIVETLEKEDE
jgi:hypothetical protein